MNITNNANEAKKLIMDAFEEWALGIVDGFTANNPKMMMAGVYVKNGIRNYRKREEERIGEMIDDAALFIADEHGNVNVDKLAQDAIRFLQDADEIPYELGFIKGTIGKGAIRLHLPDNWLMRMVLGDKGCLAIKDTDIMKLAKMMV